MAGHDVHRSRRYLDPVRLAQAGGRVGTGLSRNARRVHAGEQCRLRNLLPRSGQPVLGSEAVYQIATDAISIAVSRPARP